MIPSGLLSNYLLTRQAARDLFRRMNGIFSPELTRENSMANNYFEFKQFIIRQDHSAFKVGTDAVILGSSADVSSVANALDIGAGTGLIALMLAQRSNAAVTALEPDPGSFEDLVLNIKNCNWKDRIEALNIYLQDFASSCKFDLIVSNPPYFSNSLRNPDRSKAGARHKDLLTDDELLAGVDRLLEDEGLFQVIMPKAEGEVFISEGIKYGLFCNQIIRIRPLPSAAVNRLVLAFGRKKLSLTEKELTISTGQRHEYTREYVELTKEFYLKF